MVLVRQRPGSASGVTFVTVEDETGVANLVVWLPVFERHRRTVLSAGMLACHGRVQREGEVTHVVADRLAPVARRRGAERRCEFRCLRRTRRLHPESKARRCSSWSRRRDERTTGRAYQSVHILPSRQPTAKGATPAMKVTVEIDCTPDEARHFLGLPNVAPMQDAVLAKIQKQVQEAVAATSPDALMKAWLPFSPLSPEQVQKAMAGMMTAAYGQKSGPEKS
jgi:hypothetical protein